MTVSRRRTQAVAGAAAAALALTAVAAEAGSAEAAQQQPNRQHGAPAAGIELPAGFHAAVFARGEGARMYGPDDIAELDGHIFVGYQNGVGTMGEPSPSGGTRSTIVEYALDGRTLATWSLVGKADGLGADALHHRIVVTVNEDGDSGLYTITPGRGGRHGDAGKVEKYAYAENPLPHGGGTDSVVVRDGVIYLSASNPAPDANGDFTSAALYRADLVGDKAVVTPALLGDATATDAVTGKQVALNLSDPDSSEQVPGDVPRFGGDFVLDSQGDGELVFISRLGTGHQRQTALDLSTQVDDTAFVTDRDGTLYVVDNATNEIIAVTGPFRDGEAFDAVPNDSTVIPGNIGTLDLKTGLITAFGSGFENPHGMLFLGEDGR